MSEEFEFEGPISQVNWEGYKTHVLTALSDAVRGYSARFSDVTDERASQVSIWTDAQAQITAIGFETLQHSQQFVREAADYSRSEGWEDEALEIEKDGINYSPADFKYRRFLEVNNTEFAPLDRLDFRDSTNERAVYSMIETCLLQVVDRAVEAGLFRSLHREEKVLVGVNTPDDWYEHLRQV